MGLNEPADSKHLNTDWDFKHNWRDFAGANSRTATPRAAGDHELKPEMVKFVNRDPSNADFLRPFPESPLAKGGAGKEDPLLPIYVGAVPPKGVQPSDWDKTWKERAPKAEPQKSKAGQDSPKPRGQNDK